MSVKLQYASDIHLEISPSKFRRILTPVGDILVLAGDIGHPFRRTYDQFLEWCSINFEHTVLVPGNNEYHGSSLKKGRRKLKRLCKKHGISLLDRGVLELPEYGIVILGTTLWSDIPADKELDVLFTINDYQCIEGFGLREVETLYDMNRKWLEEKIDEYKSMEIVVVTHHAPLLEITSDPKYRGKSNNCAFASDCSDLMDGVKVWIFGHTHYNTVIRHSDTLVISNQRGHRGEACYSNYRKDQYITIGSSESL